VTADDQGRIYSDSGGWSIVVPPGWRVVPFRALAQVRDAACDQPYWQ
jgi:hypothetical protein